MRFNAPLYCADYRRSLSRIVGGWGMILLVLGLPQAQIANAQVASGESVLLPTPPVINQRAKPVFFSKKSGLQIRVDSTWAGNRGYRPVTVTVTTAKPATADTLISIEFFAGTWRNNSRSICVEQEFELPQGATSVAQQIAVPQYLDWNTYGWKLWVDGVLDEQLSLTRGNFNVGNNGSIAVGLLLPQLGKTNPTHLLNSMVGGSLQTQLLDASNLPADWLEYTTLDLVTASVDSLEFTRVALPEKYAELLRWVRAGGNLWVLGLGQDYQQLSKLAALLDSEFDLAAAVEKQRLEDWHFLSLEDQSRDRINDLLTLSMQLENENRLTGDAILESQDPIRAQDSRRWFVARALGLGRVVALQTQGSSTDGTLAALQRTSLISNLDWATRHGNDPSLGNRDFNNWLIPDVGAAPVFEFQMLITLFVIAIGPLNYWLLKRRNQLPVLLITVPAAALAATLFLFAYGFLADGISTRVRVRSITLLDQEKGEVACWSRQSYYSGIAPADGLQLLDDTAIYPILPAQSEYSSFGRRHFEQQRELEWKGKEQLLSRGWLASRTPTQYLAVTAQPTRKSLDFDESSDQLAVTNRLGADVLTLVAQDHEGNFFLGNSIASEDSAQLEPIPFAQAASTLRRLHTENLPQLPANFVAGKGNRGGDYGVSSSNGLLELQMEAMVSPQVKGWGNGTYYAVTATGIEVALGVEGATETDSFHVLRGNW